MSSTTTTSVIETKQHCKNTKNANSKKKFKFDRSGRKRSKSFSGGGLGKLKNLKPVLPTKFLLGGNINDPLNLNSLQDEEINRAMNAVTPKSSPIPTPPRRKEHRIDPLIPTNIHDPLHLTDCADDAEYEQQLCSPVKKARKKRLKKRRSCSATLDSSDCDVSVKSEAKTPETSDSARIPDEGDTGDIISRASRELKLELSPRKDKIPKRKSEEHRDSVKKLRHSMDKIVSPVIPQPGAWLKRSNSGNRRPQPRVQKRVIDKLPQFKEKDKQFQYGNYNRYYGYRNPLNEMDPRLRVFSHHTYLFEGKDILDIGCNIGHISLTIARDFSARTVIGIDIDTKLIGIARKNTKHYVKSFETPKNDERGRGRRQGQSSEFFPISMPIIYGPIDIPGFSDRPHGKGFPNNVIFKQCNYVLSDDSFIALEQPAYDTILCLSTTKWIHLNWGDSGIKQSFRRMYAQLRPGGRLILEPQNWASYKSKKKLTETIYKNYNSIEFFPDKFTEYLLSPAVGFAKSEVLGFPQHQSKGFRRPLVMFTKSTMFPSERVEATPSNSITPSVSAYNDPFYQSLKSERYEPQGNTNVDIQHVYTDLYDQYGEAVEETTSFDSNNLEKEDSSDIIESSSSKRVASEVYSTPEDGVDSTSNLDSVLESPDPRLGFDELFEKMECESTVTFPVPKNDASNNNSDLKESGRDISESPSEPVNRLMKNCEKT